VACDEFIGVSPCLQGDERLEEGDETMDRTGRHAGGAAVRRIERVGHISILGAILEGRQFAGRFFYYTGKRPGWQTRSWAAGPAKR